MPISPENRCLYPPDWPEISRRIRFERAGGRCECTGQCGADHAGRCKARHGKPHPETGSKVVLTTMHLEHDPTKNEDGDLLAGCQLCHNRYDQPHRQKNAARTRRAKSPQRDWIDEIEAA